MRQARLFLLLLTPSVSSLAGCLIIAAAIPGVAAWHQFDDSAIGREYLEMRPSVPHGVNSFLSSLFTDSIAYNLLLLGLAMAITAVLYIGLQLFDKGLAGVLETMSLTAARKSDKKDASRRYGVRIVALCAWIVYLMFTFKTLLPVCLLTSRMAVGVHDWAGVVSVFLVLAVAIHIHVVLARLVHLRPRLFGGGDALIAAHIA